MKNFRGTLCLFLAFLVLSGFVHHNNLKDLVIIEGMAVDNVEDKVEVTLQSLNVGKSTGVEKPEGNMTVNSSASGKTIIDALGYMSKSLSNEMFFGNNKIIIFGKSVCEADFRDKLDYFLRSSDARPDIAVCMVDGKASSLLESSENDAHVPAQNIVNLINTGQDIGKSIYFVTDDLLNSYCDKTSDVFLPVLKINEKSETAQLSGVALFSDERLVKIIDDDTLLGFLLITGRLKSCVVEFDNEKFGKIGVEITSERVYKSVSVNDGKVVFNVKIKGELLINEMENGISTQLESGDMKEIASQAEQEINSLCRLAFSECQRCSSDALRVGEYLASASPQDYEKMSDSWQEHFKNADISIDTHLKLKKISDNTLLN